MPHQAQRPQPVTDALPDPTDRLIANANSGVDRLAKWAAVHCHPMADDVWMQLQIEQLQKAINNASVLAAFPRSGKWRIKVNDGLRPAPAVQGNGNHAWALRNETWLGLRYVSHFRLPTSQFL